MRLGLLSFVLLLAGCTTSNKVMDLNKPVQMDKHLFATIYKQGDDYLTFWEVSRKLKTFPEYESDVQSAQLMAYTSIAVGAVGGYLVGYNLFKHSDNQTENLLIGTGTIAVSFLLGRFSHGFLDRSVDAYNNNKKKQSWWQSVQPTVAYSSNNSFNFGLAYAF